MDHLTPSQKGAAAEAAITAKAIELGLTVLRPLCEGRRYDLVVDLEPRLLRVQCKLARRVDGVLVVHLQTSRYTPGGYVSTSYSADEIDAVGAYSAELRRCFLIPISEVAGRRAIHLRVDPAKNNQASGITWAHDYEFEEVVKQLRSRSWPRTVTGTLSEPDLGL
jgi:PD-(D/E)XK endonuclease